MPRNEQEIIKLTKEYQVTDCCGSEVKNILCKSDDSIIPCCQGCERQYPGMMRDCTQEDDIEVWGTLTKCCEAHPEFQYHTIKILAYPFKHKGVEFSKLKYNQKIFDV